MSTSIGACCRIVRMARHMTHKQVAERLGTSRQNYSRIEADLIDVPASKILKLAEIFEVPPAMLLPRVREATPPS